MKCLGFGKDISIKLFQKGETLLPFQSHGQQTKEVSQVLPCMVEGVTAVFFSCSFLNKQSARGPGKGYSDTGFWTEELGVTCL